MKSGLIYLPNGGVTACIPQEIGNLRCNYVEIRVKVLDAEGVRWLTGVNATFLQNKSPFNYTNVSNLYGKQDVGDDAPNPNSWTGGWVNRVQVRRFTAGFDLLYHFGESEQSYNYQ